METNTKPTPIDILKAVSPEGARTFMDHRAAILENPKLDALPKRLKLLVGIGVAAALGSSTCTTMWTRMANNAGVSNEEIAEAILVARLMKMATVNDAAAEAFAWLRDRDA